MRNGLKKYKRHIALWCLGATALWNAATPMAQEVPSEREVTARACEKLKDGETISTARVRATDAASFNAVSNLPDLKSYKGELDSHDFNVMVYGIVDNYLEDMIVRTLKQTPEEICVEITGYVSNTNIMQGIDESFDRQTKEEVLIDETADRAADLSAAVTTELKKATAEYENQETKRLEKEEIVYQEKNAKENTAPLIEPEQKVKETPVAEKAENPIRKEGLIFVEATEFFNQSHSEYYSKIIKNWFSGNNNFLITEDKSLADFVLKPKILRAKVETINAESNRLQMVTSLELVYTDSGKSYTEHQNRFVVYGNDEGEQEVAYKLMKKLLEDSCEELQSGMENYVRRKYTEKDKNGTLPAVITPAKTFYSSEDD